MSAATAGNAATNSSHSPDPREQPLPDHLAAFLGKLSKQSSLKLRGSKLWCGPTEAHPNRPAVNHPERVRGCIEIIRAHRLTLDDALALAQWPDGLGCDPSHPDLLRALWPVSEQEDAAQAARKADAEAKKAKLYDPWEEPSPPQWPGGVLSREAEDTIAALCLRDGLDFGVQAMAYIAAASGAAPKNTRLAPYPGSDWRVPPIIWVMLLAESGQRKTALLDNAFGALRHIHREGWAEWHRENKKWLALSKAAQKDTEQPAQPHSYIVDDATTERLQLILAANSRGPLVLKDELASLFDFGRYSQGSGASERAFYLEAYEGGSRTIHRIGRGDVYIENLALTIFGGTQPDRLAAFKDLQTDGLLQRFAVVRPARSATSRPDVATPNKHRLHQAIDRLARMTEPRQYHTNPEGAALIRETEREGHDFAELTDFGQGFQGFSGKLHGTHARLALILHLLEAREDEQIATDTIHRAGRLTRQFLLPHACDFYGHIPGADLLAVREIAGWLLTRAPTRALASDFTSGIKAIRGVSSKRLRELLDPLVTGGWLDPEEPYPSNRAWIVNPDIYVAFPEQKMTQAARRAATRALILSLRSKRP